MAEAIQSLTSQRFRELLKSLSGISLPEGKVAMIEQRLRRRVVLARMPDTETYLQELMQGKLGQDEIKVVLDLLTTNTTSFFREAEHFDFLTEVALKEFLDRTANDRRKFKVWSAASSEGAEAFTAAMVLNEAAIRRKFEWAILGTDISRRMVQRANQAVYEAEQIKLIPRHLSSKYFMRGTAPEVATKVRVVPELRRRVKFRHMNLMDPTYPLDRDINVIFLRNVLIYFDADDKSAVVRRMQDHLAPGGYLITGHAESMIVRSEGLEHVQPTIFKKAL